MYLSAATHDLKTLLCGQIARAAAVFCVDEIVIFDDGESQKGIQRMKKELSHHVQRDEESGYTAFADPDSFIAHLLSYLETPPHLRKHVFPHHPDLRTAGTLPSLDMPHHLRAHEWCRWREGITLPSPSSDAFMGTNDKSCKKKNCSVIDKDKGHTTLVDVGLIRPASIPVDVPPYTRVTLDFGTETYEDALPNLTARPVAPSEPRELAGYYWGYTTRLASSLSAVFTECSWISNGGEGEMDNGYDVSIGFSERGSALDSVLPVSQQTSASTSGSAGLVRLPEKFQHALLVFGGVAGLETAVEADAELASKSIGRSNAKDLFDYWINLCPEQGSRTIRTEEAVWLGLMGTRDWVRRSH